MRFTGVLTCGVGNRRGRMGRIRWTTMECGALAAHRSDGVLTEHEQPGLVGPKPKRSVRTETDSHDSPATDCCQRGSRHS